MTPEQFYRQMGQDYTKIRERMADSETLVIKFLKRFCEDETFAALAEAVSAGDTERIFQEAHALRGVTANLGLKPLCEKTGVLVEITRGGETEGVSEAFADIQEAYLKTISQIQTIA